MADAQRGELRQAYRTLNDPTRLLGVSLAGWVALLLAGGIAYAFLGISPLPWRLNFSVVVIGLGGPVLLIVLREPGTIGPGRLLAAVFAWRLRPVRVVCPDELTPVRRGGLRLDVNAQAGDDESADPDNDAPWTVDND